jgi:hypothetical protein
MDLGVSSPMGCGEAIRKLFRPLQMVYSVAALLALGLGPWARAVDEPAPPRKQIKGEVGKCYQVLDKFDRSVVARFYGQDGDKYALLLPDGELGTVNKLVPAQGPFVPDTAEELRELLHKGPFAEYQVLMTDHYLIFYKSTAAFARDSGRLLEELYRGLIEAFNRNAITVSDAEFPLVAVIFATEKDFREHKEVPPQVQAYYEYFTNRIFMYQKSERDEMEPKVAALLKPQTVAHEGAHQILANIGVQPRSAGWPSWLSEGLAEYCATTVTNRKGVVIWSGMGAVNSLHMATLRELDDPLTFEANVGDGRAVRVGRQRHASVTECLLLKTALTPTDYARSWALTHFLARLRGSDFVKFLKVMSQLPPLQPRTPEQNLAEFRKIFGDDLTKIDKKVDEHIRRLVKRGGYDPLPWYAVVFMQELPGGMMRYSANVSQSPQVIQTWVEEITMPNGGIPRWDVSEWSTRERAIMAVDAWKRSLN